MNQSIDKAIDDANYRKGMSSNTWLRNFIKLEHERKFIDDYLEIGTWNGASAIAVASLGIPVISLDINTRPEAVQNVKQLKLSQYVKFIEGNSIDYLPQFPDSSMDIVYVDGDHEPSVAERDINQAFRISRRIVLVHDVDNKNCKRLRNTFLKIINTRKDFTAWEIIPHEKATYGMGVIYL